MTWLYSYTHYKEKKGDNVKVTMKQIAENTRIVSVQLAERVASMCKEIIDADPMYFVSVASDGIRSDALFGEEIEDLLEQAASLSHIAAKLEDKVSREERISKESE